MTVQEFVFDLKQKLNNCIKNSPPTAVGRAYVLPYQECKQYKMKELQQEASKYGQDFIIQKAIHFPTTVKSEHNQYRKQGGIIVYYKSDMKKASRYNG